MTEQQQKNQQIEKQKNKQSTRTTISTSLYYYYCYHCILELLYDGLVPGRIAGYAKHNFIMNKSHILMRSLCYVDHTHHLKQ